MKTDTKAIGEILGAFPPEQRYSLAILHAIQQEYGCISADNLKAAARHLNMPFSQIFSVVTFYDAFSIQKLAKMVLQVCDGTTCHTQGGPSILSEIEKALGIKAGETTPDGLFSLEIVYCMGACAMAPVVVCGKKYLGNVSQGKAEAVVKTCREEGGI